MTDRATDRLPTTIAIDGPAGVGKSTVGALLAARLGYVYFDTGVLYRAVTLAALRRGVAFDDAARLADLAASLSMAVQSPTVADGRQATILLDGEDVTWDLRRPEINQMVSIVAAVPGVRRALLDRQREIGRRGRVVMVGRDIGTTVLPTAGLKIYLDASLAVRARRRYAELRARGEPADLAAVQALVERRDHLDSERAASPLRPAPDAIRIDTNNLDVEAVLERILALVHATT